MLVFGYYISVLSLSMFSATYVIVAVAVMTGEQSCSIQRTFRSLGQQTQRLLYRTIPILSLSIILRLKS